MKRVLATSMFVAATVGQQVLERELRMLRAPVRTNNESEETDPALDDYVVEEPKSTPVVEPVTPEVEAIEPEEPVSEQIQASQPEDEEEENVSEAEEWVSVDQEDALEPQDEEEDVEDEELDEEPEVVEPTEPIVPTKPVVTPKVDPVIKPEIKPEPIQRQTTNPIIVPSDSVDIYKPMYNGNCWKRAYSRPGKGFHACPEGYERDGLFCYPICRTGYKGVLADCQKKCPQNWKDDGLYCHKPDDRPNQSYPSISKCEEKTGKKCEKKGLGYFARCDVGWHRALLGYCSINCPHGMDDIGISCHKDIYMRESVDLDCSPDEEKVLLTCFPKCAPGTISDGATCWTPCPMGTIECGSACLHPSTNCAVWIIGMITGSVGTVVDVATSLDPVGGVSRAIEGAGGLATSLSMPNCP